MISRKTSLTVLSIQTVSHALCFLLFGFSSLTPTAATSDFALDATSPLNFAASKWIWSSATAKAHTFVGFRKDFAPPLGKSLVAAEIIFTIRLHARFACRFCVDLLPHLNVFAVNASTATAGADEGGFIATILVTYSDGTTDTILTDSSWRVKSPIPLGFEELSFNNTHLSELLR
ncbi:hypothetical protein B0H19DRAFT_1261153 [Mycena capillaripes]|nr:hypothetical protein B0H19DRAFT_1261153 [Mycena capillaripes]